ncbi:MAG: O-antigen ligase family protein [Ignavibacteria bacterium]
MATGVFMHPNTASHFYTILIPILLYKILSGKSKLVIILPIFLLCVTALLFTFSRAGYIGTGLAMITLIFFKSKKIFIFSLIIFIASYFFIINDFIATKEDSSISRIILWITAIDMITRDSMHMIWGYGVFNALEVFQNEKFFFGSREVVPDPHNSFLLFSIQFGLLFSVSLTVFIIVIYLKLFFRRTNLIIKKHFTQIFLAISVTIGILFQNMFENILVYPEYYVMPFYLIFLGYIYNTTILASDNE